VSFFNIRTVTGHAIAKTKRIGCRVRLLQPDRAHVKKVEILDVSLCEQCSFPFRPVLPQPQERFPFGFDSYPAASK
jgi:hypothetical protein